MTTNLLTKIKCFLSLGEIIVHPNLGALNKPSLTMVKKNYSSSTFAFIGILPLPGRSRFVKIYLTLQSLTAFCFSLRPPSSGYSCIRHYLLVPYGFSAHALLQILSCAEWVTLFLKFSYEYPQIVRTHRWWIYSCQGNQCMTIVQPSYITYLSNEPGRQRIPHTTHGANRCIFR